MADLHTPWLAWYNKEYNDVLTVDKITEWDMTKFVKPECGKHIYDFLKFDSIYDDVPVIEGSVQMVTSMRSFGRIVFVTSEVQGVKFTRKFYWLKSHGLVSSLDDYVVCSDKSLIHADLLIDDYDLNVKNFKGLGRVLFDQPWNRSFTDYPRIIGWAEVLEVLPVLDLLKSSTTT